MEINLLGFIILLVNNNNNESALKYFLIQSLRSVILISSALLLENFSFVKLQLIISLSLFLKLGTAPLHFWLPAIVENLTNYQLIFLLT
jgi:NADH:ubiquinone oxidoreductase subunit 2 (subunit N)